VECNNRFSFFLMKEYSIFLIHSFDKNEYHNCFCIVYTDSHSFNDRRLGWLNELGSWIT
jgi:hypothetical protein